MAVSLTRFCWRMWSGKDKGPPPNGSNLLSSSSERGFGARDHDNLKFPPFKGKKIAPSPRKIKRRWKSREQRRLDKEFDIVLVPSDGVCLSGSESEDSDWSIGWSEPHGPDFHSDDEVDSSFAVLVPCYKPDSRDMADDDEEKFLSAIMNLQNKFTIDSSKYMEQWLSSLQNC